MMGLSERQRAFLDRRERLLRYWRFWAVLPVLIWLGLVAWLWLAHPLLVNPIVVQQQLHAGQLASGTVLALAVMLPILVDLCLLLALVVVLFVALAARNERNYHEIVRAMAGGSDVSRF